MARRRYPIERPFTTRECADWMGVTTDFIRGEIADGRLVAQRIVRPDRRRVLYRILRRDFIEYLTRVGWHRLPPAREC